MLRVTNGARYWIHVTKQNRCGLFILQTRIQTRDIENKQWTKNNYQFIDCDISSREKYTSHNERWNHTCWVIREVLSKERILSILICRRYEGAIWVKSGSKWKTGLEVEKKLTCARNARQLEWLGLEAERFVMKLEKWEGPSHPLCPYLFWEVKLKGLAVDWLWDGERRESRMTQISSLSKLVDGEDWVWKTRGEQAWRTEESMVHVHGIMFEMGATCLHWNLGRCLELVVRSSEEQLENHMVYLIILFKSVYLDKLTSI